MAVWFFGPILEKIRSTCFDYLEDQLVLHTDMNEALERLQKLHPKIQSVIFACNQEQIIDPALKRWLWQLRDAIDEADDVLDDFEYMKHEEQLTKNNDETEKRKASSSASFLIESVQKIYKGSDLAIKMHPNLKRLKEVVQKLDKVSAEVSTFLHLLESTKQEQQEQQRELYKARETGSLPRNDLIGRCKEKEFVMQWLTKPSNEHRGTDLYRKISVLSIVGHGGMGKTTLLQHVYEDKMTEEFDLKMWICVSNNFDAKKVIADMLESIKKKKPNLDSLDALQGKLKEEVISKRFLLVLDDIWGEEERDKSKWENVLAPLSCGSLGSKILVTTRMDSAASIIAKVIKKKKETLTLQGLDEDECLQLLNTYAFADVENLDDHKMLRFITGQIAKKLSGSPLAAKVMGGILNSDFDEMRWRKVLDFDTGIIKDDIVPVLRLSYVYLPQPLQNCFTFCCIFPQDYEFDKDDLVRMWIALGFIQSSRNQRETMEDIGGRYFDILVKKSFFDQYDNCYKMHDLLHKLAQSISEQECFRIISENELSYSIPETIRHLAVNSNNLELVRKIGNFKNLHSLHLTFNEDDQDFVYVLTKVFETLRTIRLLCINNQHLKLIPEEIGYLRHLRYLKIARTSVAQLPRSLSNLYHLMFIIYDKGGLRIHNDFLPKDLNNLFNLRYLKLPLDVIPGMHGIGKLKFLQGLDGFYVKNEIGYKIGELEHMNDLRQLRIKLLQNVKDAEEACSAKIYQKRNLMDLSLEWNHIHINDWDSRIYWDSRKRYNRRIKTSRNFFDSYLDEKVLDNLQPHNSLKQLRIYSFMGVRSAIWMNNINLISNLECIRLEECLEWQILPPFGQLPFLKYLLLRNMPKAKLLDNKFHGNVKGCLFPSLKVLEIEKLEVLEDWFDAAAVAEGDYFFPCLTELYLRDCQHLKELPFLPPKLKKLEIDNIGWKAFNWLQCASNGCIQELKITNNDELVSFPIETEQWFLQASSSLHKLYFMGLKSLQSLPSSLASLSSLKILHVRNAPQLQMLPNIPASLKKLELCNLEKLQCMPSSLSISSLEVLDLSCIPLLKSLPDLPPSLRSLKIYLENLCCWPSCLPSLSYLQKISIISNAPHLQELPELPSSLCELSFINLESLQTLPSSLTSLSSLESLYIMNVTQLWLLPNFPTSLEKLVLTKLKSLQCLPSSLSSISSLKYLYLDDIPLLKSLPNVPPSLCWLHLCDLENLDCLPSSLSSLSSLQKINIDKVPLLQELPNLPSSLCQLAFTKLKSLQLLPNIPTSLEELSLSGLEALQYLPSSLSISSLKRLHLTEIPLLKSLPDLPPDLKYLFINKVPQLQLLPNIPASLEEINLFGLEALQFMPSSLPISSLKRLHLTRIMHLKSLPDLSPSLEYLLVNNVSQLQLLQNIPASTKELYLSDLEALQCLPSSLSISSLKRLHLTKISLLKSLPNLPPDLKYLFIDNVPQLQLLPNIPASLEVLNLSGIEALQFLPSSLPISSLKRLHLTGTPLLKSLPDLPPSLESLSVNNIPQLQLLPNIAASLEELNLSGLEALQLLPSSLPISSLKRLHLIGIPLLKSLPDLPPSLESLSVNNVPQLQLLQNIPASLEELKLSGLKALQFLPSSLPISSLKRLHLNGIQLLKSLPDLPPNLKYLFICKVPQLQLLPNIPASMEELHLYDLEALHCLPSSMSISSLKGLYLDRIPVLKSLPDLPPGLNYLSVKHCHPGLMERYQSFDRRLLAYMLSI